MKKIVYFHKHSDDDQNILDSSQISHMRVHVIRMKSPIIVMFIIISSSISVVAADAFDLTLD